VGERFELKIGGGGTASPRVLWHFNHCYCVLMCRQMQPDISVGVEYVASVNDVARLLRQVYLNTSSVLQPGKHQSTYSRVCRTLNRCVKGRQPTDEMQLQLVLIVFINYPSVTVGVRLALALPNVQFPSDRTLLCRNNFSILLPCYLIAPGEAAVL